MNSQLNERQNQIAELARRHGEVKVAELSRYFGVVEMTIRRDLEKMEQLGLLHRTFGGAIPSTKDVAMGERLGVNLDGKMRIGKAAATYIRPGKSIFIDAGTTTLQVAKHLKAGSDTTVVTNAPNITMDLVEKQISTIVVGGILRESTLSLVGPIAEETISKMAFDQAFIGAVGLTVEHGFSNSNIFEAELKREAIKRATEIIMVLDHSKFGVKSLTSFIELQSVHRIITDQTPPQTILEACQELGIDIVIA